MQSLPLAKRSRVPVPGTKLGGIEEWLQQQGLGPTMLRMYGINRIALLTLGETADFILDFKLANFSVRSF